MPIQPQQQNFPQQPSHLMPQTPFQNPYASNPQWDMYYWNMYYAQAGAQAYAAEMAYK